MASSDEDDYMSDKLLQQLDDVRPGVPMKRTQHREFENSKRKAALNASNRTKKLHVLEAERREEGLAKPIDESNKGFSLLSKMGFKPGVPIGAGQPSSSEPIELKLKTDGRGGLGLAAKKGEESKERIERHLREASKRDCVKMTENFRADKQNVFNERLLRADLHRSQRVCRQLEMEAGKTEPSEVHFWPPAISTEEEEDNEDDQAVKSEAEMLEDITAHLRDNYFYCIWCGCRYSDEEDLKQCPGDKRQDHDDDD